MKIFKQISKEEIYLKIHGTQQTVPLPIDGFVETDGMEKVLKNLGLLQEYQIENAELREYKGQALNSKSILIMRRGGYGDLLWITCIAKKLKSLYPTCKIRIASMRRHHMIFKTNKDVEYCIDYPIKLKEFKNADYHLTFENCIEPVRKPISVYTLFQQRAEIVLTNEECIPVYKVQDIHLNPIRKYLRDIGIKDGDLKIMFHMGASCTYKSWPPQNILSAAICLAESGCKVFLAGNKKDFPFELPYMKNLYNVCNRKRTDNKQIDDYWSMEHAIALLSKMDILVGQDSAFTHFAAALDIPTIAIYGAFPAVAYLSTYPKAIAVEPDKSACPLLPCYPHTDNPCPSTDRFGYAPCFKSISSDRVIDIIAKRWGVKMVDRSDVEIRGG